MPRYLDLTQPLSPLTARSSDHPEVTFATVRHFSRDGVKTHNILANLHSGTHVDTAALFFFDGETVDKVDISRFIGTALFVDCRLGEMAPITAAHLEKHASSLTSDEILVLCTGWHHHMLDEEKYVLRAPGLDRSGVDWVAKKHPKALGSDSPTPEHVFMRYGQWRNIRSDMFPNPPDAEAYPRAYAHKVLLPKGIVMIEGLGGEIDQLIGKRATLFALPAKYSGVEAAPVRAVAVLEE